MPDAPAVAGWRQRMINSQRATYEWLQLRVQADCGRNSKRNTTTSKTTERGTEGLSRRRDQHGGFWQVERHLLYYTSGEPAIKPRAFRIASGVLKILV